MTTKATSGVGVKIQIGDAAEPEVFTTIAEITDFNGPNETSPSIDVSNFDSEAREFIAGLKDGGEVTFSCNFVGSNAQQQALRTAQKNRVKKNFKILINDAALDADKTTIELAANVTGFSLTGSVDAAIKAAISLKVSGEPAFTYADAA